MRDVNVWCFVFCWFFFAYTHSTCLIWLSWSGSRLTFPVRIKRSSGYWGDIAKVCTKLLINNREIVASEQQGFFQKFSKWNISDHFEMRQKGFIGCSSTQLFFPAYSTYLQYLCINEPKMWLFFKLNEWKNEWNQNVLSYVEWDNPLVSVQESAFCNYTKTTVSKYC